MTDNDYKELKLGQLEDIEEELGIDLITLFNALKFGVYYFTNAGQLTRDYVWLMDNYMGVRTNGKLSYSFMTMFQKQTLLFNDYGKTWALTKEELEKKNKIVWTSMWIIMLVSVVGLLGGLAVAVILLATEFICLKGFEKN
jgi:hypothetical protein